jgi:hypothetical protein
VQYASRMAPEQAAARRADQARGGRCRFAIKPGSIFGNRMTGLRCMPMRSRVPQ